MAGGRRSGGGMVLGGFSITFEEPEPCSDEPQKTYYKCAAGHCYCACPPGKVYRNSKCRTKCPAGKTWRSAAGACIADSSASGGGGTIFLREEVVEDQVEAVKARNAAEMDSRTLDAVSTAEMPDTVKRVKKEVEEAVRKDQPPIFPKSEPRDNYPQIQGKRLQDENDKKIIEQSLEGTPAGEIRKQIQEAMKIKDVTDRPDDKIRKFTIRLTSTELDGPYGDYYRQHRVDNLAEQGTEIREDRYEVVYSEKENQAMRSQFGLIVHPAEHQRIINNVFLTFADEMLKTQVQTLDTFSHIGQSSINNSQISALDLSEAAASVKPKYNAEQAAELAALEAAGVFGRPKSAPRRPFGMTSTRDPFAMMGMNPTTIAARGNRNMDLFKYGSKNKGPFAGNTKFKSAGGGFKINPSGYRMELGASFKKSPLATASKAGANVTKSKAGAYARASMESRKQSKKPTSGLQKSMNTLGRRRRSNAMNISTGNSGMGSRKMGYPARNEANANPSPNKTMNPNQGPTRKTKDYRKRMRNKGGNY
jgi:hypothetical protein